MRQQRRFSNDLKRQINQELISGARRPAQLCRRHEIAPSLLYHWKKQYNLGKLDNEPIKEAAMQDRIEKLERLVGKLTLENEFLKKAYQHKLSLQGKNGKSSNSMDPNSRMSARDVS